MYPLPRFCSVIGTEHVDFPATAAGGDDHAFA